MLEIKEISIEDFEEKLLNDYQTLFPKDEQRNWEGVRRTYNDNDEGLCIDIEKVDINVLHTLKRALFYEKLDFKKIDSTYDIFNVLYTPYYWNNNKTYTKEELNKIMFDYYEVNAGKERVKKYFKIKE